jgi:hypothetical protein
VSGVTPRQAVACGHLMVTLPVVLIMIAVILVLWISLGPRVGLLIGVFAGPGTAWIWWSFMVPRWRDWVIDNGLHADDVQRAAALTGLVWPRGSLFERTEFRRRNGTRGW